MTGHPPLRGIPDIPNLGWEGGALKEGPRTGVCLAADQTSRSEGGDPVAGQISGDVGPRTGVGLVADQTSCSEGAGPVAGQTSCNVGTPPEQQRGEVKAGAMRRRKAAASPPGPPLTTAARREASPPGPPLAKTCPLAPPLKEWLPDIPKTGWEEGPGAEDAGDEGARG